MRSSTVLAVVGVLLTQSAAAGFLDLPQIFSNVVSRSLDRRQGNGCQDPGSYNEVCDCCGCTCSTPDYLFAMCFPDNETDTGMYEPTVTAPCELYYNEYLACLPNGTETLDYIAEQECKCKGGFFQYYFGCQTCAEDHGAVINTANFYVPTTAVSEASTSFCTGQPTNSFEDILFSVYTTLTPDPSVTDIYPNQTAVSLYFTATGSTAIGAITGSATEAATSSADDDYSTYYSSSQVSYDSDFGVQPSATSAPFVAAPEVTTTLLLTTTVTAAAGGATTSSTNGGAQVTAMGGVLAAGLFGVAFVL